MRGWIARGSVNLIDVPSAKTQALIGEIKHVLTSRKVGNLEERDSELRHVCTLGVYRREARRATPRRLLRDPAPLVSLVIRARAGERGVRVDYEMDMTSTLGVAAVGCFGVFLPLLLLAPNVAVSNAVGGSVAFLLALAFLARIKSKGAVEGLIRRAAEAICSPA